MPLSPITVAVLLARGLGTRLRAAGAALDGAAAAVAATGVKALMPVGRPFIDYLLHDLAEAGMEEVVVVIGPEHDALRAHLAALPLTRLRVRTAVQELPRGTADAVAAAATAVAGRRFLVVNGDNRYPVAGLAALARVAGSGLVGFARAGLLRGGIPAARLDRFAAIASADGVLTRIVEKPDAAAIAALGGNPPLSMNCWAFTPAIFPACAAVRPSPRGELELTDAVAGLVAAGERFAVVPSDGAVLDLSSRDDVAGLRAILEGQAVRL
jgi:dTDP-glucose pyrophosphorylase